MAKTTGLTKKSLYSRKLRKVRHVRGNFVNSIVFLVLDGTCQDKSKCQTCAGSSSTSYRTSSDVRFPQGVELPNILDAMVIENEGAKLILETQKHIGEDTVRAISMDATEGFAVNGTVATGSESKCLLVMVKGRLFNVVGDVMMVLEQ